MSALPGVPQHRTRPPTDTTWMARAACKGTPTSWWFPAKGVTPQAAHLCAHCPVTEQCLDYALRHHEWAGTWGGCSAEKRREIAKWPRHNDPTHLKENRECTSTSSL